MACCACKVLEMLHWHMLSYLLHAKIDWIDIDNLIANFLSVIFFFCPPSISLFQTFHLYHFFFFSILLFPFSLKMFISFSFSFLLILRFSRTFILIFLDSLSHKYLFCSSSLFSPSYFIYPFSSIFFGLPRSLTLPNFSFIFLSFFNLLSISLSLSPFIFILALPPF